MKFIIVLFFVMLLFSIVGCGEVLPVISEGSLEVGQESVEGIETEFNEEQEVAQSAGPTLEEIKEVLINKYSSVKPREWGEHVSGVINSIDTEDKVIALTFDACGGGVRGNGFDDELISFLIDNDVPATLFISGNWIDNNFEIFEMLSEVPLFSIQNHGHLHKPLSVQGESAYGIKGTSSVAEVIDEIVLNDEKIFAVTGVMPRYFRSGTAYYDELAVKIGNELDKEIINFSVVGDGGATFSQKQIERALLSAKPGAIVLLHMNRPDTMIADGVMAAVGQLKELGFSFVTLDEYHDILSEKVK